MREKEKKEGITLILPKWIFSVLIVICMIASFSILSFSIGAHFKVSTITDTQTTTYTETIVSYMTSSTIGQLSLSTDMYLNFPTLFILGIVSFTFVIFAAWLGRKY